MPGEQKKKHPPFENNPDWSEVLGVARGGTGVSRGKREIPPSRTTQVEAKCSAFLEGERAFQRKRKIKSRLWFASRRKATKEKKKHIKIKK